MGVFEGGFQKGGERIYSLSLLQLADHPESELSVALLFSSHYQGHSNSSDVPKMLFVRKKQTDSAGDGNKEKLKSKKVKVFAFWGLATILGYVPCEGQESTLKCADCKKFGKKIW